MSVRVAAASEFTDFVRDRFVPTVVWARETDGFHTRLCVYNYFSEMFPDVKTGATVRIWGFDGRGELVGSKTIPLPYKGQLQFECREFGVFEGTAALALVPETVPKFSHPAVGTGYYSYYYDDDGHADFSHEWDPMRFATSIAHPWLCVIRPLLPHETEIIVMNSYYGPGADEGASRWSAKLRDGRGRVLAARQMDPIPARGSVRFAVKDVFPDVLQLARAAGTVAFEAAGENIMGPFSFVWSPGGDFNVHHFC